MSAYSDFDFSDIADSDILTATQLIESNIGCSFYNADVSNEDVITAGAVISAPSFGVVCEFSDIYPMTNSRYL